MERIERKPQKSPVREVLEWAATLGAAVLLALAVHTWIGQFVSVSGPSMENTLPNPGYLLCGKTEYWSKSPKRGDIVAVRLPMRNNEIYVKRVIATGGERISVSGNAVYINGKKLVEPYLKDDYIDYELAELTVPDGYIFALGDNRNDSDDSSVPDIGPVSVKNVIGRIYLTVWPLDRFQKVTEYKGKLEE